MNHLDVPGRNLRKVSRLWFVSKKETMELYNCLVKYFSLIHPRDMRFEVFMAVKIRQVFWAMTSVL